MAVVIAVPGNEDQAARLAKRVGAEVMAAEVRRFPDGELYVRIHGDLTGKEVALVGSLYPSPAERFMVVAFLAETARDLGAKKVGLVAPYLAFMRQDNQFNPGEGITSTYFARLVSSSVDWMVTVDPHLHRLDSLDGIYRIPTTIARSASAIGRTPDEHSASWKSRRSSVSVREAFRADRKRSRMRTISRQPVR
jgi:ribose-phosphate pyrophosphokinase